MWEINIHVLIWRQPLRHAPPKSKTIIRWPDSHSQLQRSVKKNINWVFSPEKHLLKEFTSCSPLLQLFGELGSSEDSPAQSSAALSVGTYSGFLSNLTLMYQMIQVKDSIYLEKDCCFFKKQFIKTINQLIRDYEMKSDCMCGKYAKLMLLVSDL